MAVGLGEFTRFAQTTPDASRAVTGPNDSVVDGSGAKPSNWASVALHSVLDKICLGFLWKPVMAADLTAENTAAVNAFAAALDTRYGGVGRDLAIHVPANQPLTAARITQTSGDAALQHAREVAHGRVVDAAAIREAVDVVMQRSGSIMSPVNAPIAGAVRTTLEALYTHIARVDGTLDASLPIKVCQQLTARLEDCLSRAVTGGHLIPPRDLAADLSVAAAITAAHGAVGGLAGAVPGFQARLDAEANAFRHGIETALTRIGRDQGAVHAEFFGGSAPLAGLHDLHITDSDPHKGGNRVVILDFGGDRQLVYKPRDVRIDQAIAGSNLAGGGRSMLQLAGADALTYRFKPMQDPGSASVQAGQYGYVEHLSHGDHGDCVLNRAETQNYYLQLGRGVAGMMFAGAADLHHENIMASQKKPYFSDLEFALGQTTLRKVNDLLTAARASGDSDDAAAALRTAFSALMENMSLHAAVTEAVDKNALRPELRVDNEGVLRGVLARDDVTESLIVLREDDGTLRDNHGALAVRPPQLTLNAEFATHFAQGIEDGLTAMYAARDAYSGWLDNAVGLTVRYHPINTNDQRETLVRYLNTAYGADSAAACTPAALNASVEFALDHDMKRLFPGPALDASAPSSSRGMAADPPPKAVALKNAMMDGYAVHDIPYFGRAMNDSRVFVDGERPLTWEGDRDNFFEVGDRQSQRGALPELLGAMDDATFNGAVTKIKTAAQSWLAGMVPQHGGRLHEGIVDPKTHTLLRDLGAVPSAFAPKEQI